MKIVRGIQKAAVKTTLHGVEGIGKTTLASKFPNPVFLDTEDGTTRLDVARVRCPDWVTLEGAVLELSRDSQGFQTVVIDSIDWAERLFIQKLLTLAKKDSIESFGFGKGFTMVGEAMGKFLDSLDGLVDKGMHVVLIGHTKVARTSPPDMDEGYDRFELKLTKQSGPLVKEWSDCILFANYRVQMVEGTDGRRKARGGTERVLHTERTAAFDAKNRFGLPPEIPMEIEALAPMLSPARQGWREMIAAATTGESLDELRDKLDAAVRAGRLTPDQHATLAKLMDDRASMLEAA